MQTHEPNYRKMKIPHIRVTFPKPPQIVGSDEQLIKGPKQLVLVLLKLFINALETRIRWTEIRLTYLERVVDFWNRGNNV